MSTATITPNSTVRHPAAPGVARLHLTRRGRVVVTTLAAIPLLVGVGLGVLNGGQATAGNDDTHARTTFQTVTIEPGESLWQLAEEQAPTADPRQFVQDVVDLNNLDGSAVQAGQQVAIPTSYTTGH